MTTFPVMGSFHVLDNIRVDGDKGGLGEPFSLTISWPSFCFLYFVAGVVVLW